VSPRVVVIGGGLAGITAAIALAESGAQVSLLEARPRLGGATCSFSRDGLTVDTGQHVFLGCCTAYRGLLGTLGMAADAPIQRRFDVTVLAPGPSSRSGSVRRARLRRTALPGPLHMLPALARYSFLSFPERSSVSRPALAMRRLDPADPALDTCRFGDWLAGHGQAERARRVLWDLFTVSALNIAGDDASLALAATVVKTGLLGKNNAADIGVPARPLGELHGDAAAALLASLGAQVVVGAKVTAIEPVDDGDGGTEGDPLRTAAPAPRFRVRLARSLDSSAAGGTPDVPGARDAARAALSADAVVLAVPHEAAARLIPAGALPDRTVAGWAGLGASPIVNVHVIYDRVVMDLPFAAAVDSPVQWVFDRTHISGLDRLTSASAPASHPAAEDRPQYLAISLSAADDYVDVPAAKLRDLFVPALAELFPAARDAQTREFFVTRERRATFRQAPGSGALRPQAGTRLPGLVLAGAWTDTGWPDTMEGAVRSGLAAAVEVRRTLRSAGPAPLQTTVPAAGPDPLAAPSGPDAFPPTPSVPDASPSTMEVR
jgi:squalene-associated FAD-dependent desaturase